MKRTVANTVLGLKCQRMWILKGLKYGYAKYLRDALPNATFIAFTGTPIEKADRSTPAVFGKIIDTYDINQAVEDGSTVRIYYESRLAKIELKPEERPYIDQEFEEVTEGEESRAKNTSRANGADLKDSLAARNASNE